MREVEKCLDFENDPELSMYENWYANQSPKEIRKFKGRQIIYVDHVDKHRGYFSPEVNIIADAHYSFIIFEDGNTVDKRDIIECGILKLKKEMTNPKFVLKKTDDDQFHFTLQAKNGETIMQSETYTEKHNALSGVSAVCNAVSEILRGANETILTKIEDLT